MPRRKPILVEFTDSYGEKQIIHRHSGRRLTVRRKEPTVSLALSKVIGRMVGERIREERNKAGLTLRQLSERAGMTGGKQSMFAIENAMDVGIRLGTLYAVASALNVSPFSLLPPVSVVLAATGVQLQISEKLAV